MTTLFTDRVTTITAAWLNSVDAVITDPAVTALTALTPAADQLPYYTGASSASATTLTSFARGLLALASAAAVRAGIDAQQSSTILNALVALSGAADKVPYYTGATTLALADFTATGRGIVSQISTASALTYLGAAGLASPAFTGIPTAPTAAVDTNTTQIATTAFVIGQAYAKLASPTFTGTPAAPTAAVDTNTTQIATTAFVIGQAYAKLASPTFTGTPAAPTAAVDTNTTQIATTAFVIGQAYAKLASPTFTGTVTLPAVAGGGLFDLNNNAIQEAKTICFNGVVDDGNSGTSDTIDFTAGQYHKSTMTGNCAFTYTAPTGPCVVQHELTQSSGGHTYSTTPALKWPGNYTATDKLLSTGAGARDLLILRWNGTDYVANLIKNIA